MKHVLIGNSMATLSLGVFKQSFVVYKLNIKRYILYIINVSG